jgi:hypothetical protein
MDINDSSVDQGSTQATESSQRKPYSKPVLTHYGQMNELTQAGGGKGPNDGDYQVGSPLVPMS